MAKHEIATLEAILAGMQPKPEIVAMIEREKQEIDKAIQDQSLTLQEAIDQFLLVEKGGLAASTKKAYKTRMEMLTKHVGPEARARLYQEVGCREGSRGEHPDRPARIEAPHGN